MTESSTPPTSDIRRRRRDRSAEAPVEIAPVQPVSPKDKGRTRSVPSSWGLSPTFRVLVFLGGVLGVMVFLLYNEFLIRQFRDQERDRAELYANLYGLAISEAVPSDLAGHIFDKIIINESISFPMVVTDHHGQILNWKGPGLPASGDTSPKDMIQLRAAMERMDAVNEPVSAPWYARARGTLHWDSQQLIVVDPTEVAVAWGGAALPPFDGRAESREPVQAVLSDLQIRGSSMEFQVDNGEDLYLVGSPAEFIVVAQAQPVLPVAWGGPGLPTVADTSVVARELVRQRYHEVAAESEPIAFQIRSDQIIHYGNTDLLSRISMAPFLTVGVILLFAVIGYVGFRNIRHSEQRSIWVGMAKETAHQLGTPLSSLSGWLELMSARLRDLPAASVDYVDNADSRDSVDSIVREMQKDMGRLTQIASRFSQIGSVPELGPGNVANVLRETIGYFRRRGPQFGRHTFELEVVAERPVPLNGELMGWAFENLFNNSIDAFGGQEGSIRVQVDTDTDRQALRITIVDDGRGIESEHVGRVFDPGFSTKKRGWGLGLAFVKRIVEEYHGGQIQIVRSEADRGTIFEITLPLA
ncbi:MAG: HAMP domain-containing sensor histidine kinase [Candidatus Latescibacterota bacterium]|nr:HAMP domain-containing sensor histidine kinase [Candidatus Latescibacterota bacterium]